MKTGIGHSLSVTFTVVCTSIPSHFQQLFYSTEETFQSTVTVVFYAELQFYQNEELRSLTEHVSEAVDRTNHLPPLAQKIPMLEYGQEVVIERTL